MSEHRSIRQYHLKKLVGKGGMGEVYLADDSIKRREVAIKILPRDMDASQAHVEMFAQEVRSAATLEHENLVNVLDGGNDQGSYFMVMEYIDGAGLDVLTRLLPGRKVPFPFASFIMIEVLKGLEYLHNSGTVHRDIKPANVMITKDGRVKITDFGIMATLGDKTNPGGMAGTPSFMAPELLQNDKFDHRVDIFAAGVMFLQLLIGFNPFDARQVAPTIGRILSHNPPPLYTYDSTIPLGFQRILDQMLAKDQHQRYGRCKDIIETLTEYNQQVGLPVTRDTFVQFLKDPAGESQYVRKRLAAISWKSAKEQFAQSKVKGSTFMLELYRSYLLDPANAEIKDLTEKLAAAAQIELLIPASPELRQLGEAYAADPDDFEVLMRLMDFYLKNRLKYQAYYIGRALLRVRPDNSIVQSRVEALSEGFESPLLAEYQANWQRELAPPEPPAPPPDPLSSLGDAPLELQEVHAYLHRQSQMPKLLQWFQRRKPQVLLRWAAIGLVVLAVLIGGPIAAYVYLRPVVAVFPSEPKGVRSWMPKTLIHDRFLQHDREQINLLEPDAKRVLFASEEAMLRLDYQKALDRYEEFAKFPMAGRLTALEAHFNLAIMYRDFGSVPEAVKALERVIAEQPQGDATYTLVEAQRELARLKTKLDDFPSARVHYQAMMTLMLPLRLPFDDRYLEYLIEYGNFLIRAKDPKSAEYVYRMALQRCYEPTKRGDIYRLVLKGYEECGDAKGAVEFLSDLEKQSGSVAPQDKEWAIRHRYSLTGGTGAVR